MKKNKIDIILWIICVSMMCIFLFGCAFMGTELGQLKKYAEFESIKEGLCVYVEYPNSYQGVPVPDYILVYDYEIEKVIEIDMYDELVHTRIYVGDTILYCVDYYYTDADFLNVVRE